MSPKGLALTCEEEIEDRFEDIDQGEQYASNDDRVVLEDLNLNLSYRCMLRQELQTPEYSKESEYLKYRRVLVDWMSEVGEEMRVRKTTIHSAIAYLERILMIGPLPSKDRFQVLALSCILIAAKYNGPECEVPPMSEFWEFGNRCYSINEIHSMELSTLTKLDWCLTALGPIHFVHYFVSRPVIFADDTMQDDSVVSEAIEYYRRYTEFFVDLCLQEHQFRSFRPSLVAASILAASRQALGISPTWREELELLTGYIELQVEPCFSLIWSHYSTTFGDKMATREISPTTVAEFPVYND
ncbi:unnamed protein product [Albugo candida]|uniref:Cyclin N-terminal domain-containing protein n=1 Tax=Albugo candida TaxID=65357 RepID=A0A024GC09_9STRA|nr:unnamed protein product [Albugo candida]|eukprot:CCI44075.1 unnamed protein product [Albugo candida]